MAPFLHLTWIILCLISLCNTEFTGVWSPWFNTPCSKTCGEGSHIKARHCSTGHTEDCDGESRIVSTCIVTPCAVDGSWTDWSSWSACDVTCADGLSRRIRNCSNPAPMNGGKDCLGNAKETQACTLEACPSWSAWFSAPCSKSCGEGTQLKARHCSTGHVEECDGDSKEIAPCLITPCTVDGSWTDWSPWSACDVTCEDGFSHRTRNCSNPEPKNGGKNCSGNSSDSLPCTLEACPTWSAWFMTSCSKTCGEGTQIKARHCSTGHYEDCDGVEKMVGSCILTHCPVDGSWTNWSPWSVCDVTCEEGFSHRTRNCSNPTPMYGGKNCFGTSMDTLPCALGACPTWSAWFTTSCSKTCGEGTQIKARHCSTGHYEDCDGVEKMVGSCMLTHCPVDGSWTDWSPWSACDVTCEDGFSRRTRNCSDPEPIYGGKKCSGNSTDTLPCTLEACPTWSAWYRRPCSATCGNGTLIKVRNCSTGHSENCVGTDMMTESCFLRPCPVDGSWAKWSPWSACDVTCENGVSYRTRNCSKPWPMYGGKDCSGSATDSLPCTLEACPSWSAWYKKSCSTTCGNGTLIKVRNCSTGHSENCGGNDTMIESCFLTNCPVDGSWANWSPWSACDVTCEDGVTYRTRNCSNPAPMYGGNECSGNSTDTLPCTLEACPTWSAWTKKSCSTTCGNGTLIKVRDCSTGHSENCAGNDTMTESCFLRKCPVDGSWTNWSPWSACDVTCEDGVSYRTRNCSNPEPMYGGKDCSGSATDSLPCTLEACPTWSAWYRMPCSTTCGNGTLIKVRNCSSGYSENCSGNDTMTESCFLRKCPVDGSWTNWSPWSACDVTCEDGVSYRTRNCSNPEPMYGGKDCSGSATDSLPCTLEACPTWSAWYRMPCSTTCGNGTLIKVRNCSSGYSENCSGNDTMTESCFLRKCPVDGSWTNWSPWSACDVTCEDGVSYRTRNCSSPEPMYGGKDCSGSATDSLPCTLEACPTWSAWYRMPCSTTCGNGTLIKVRNCSSGHSENCSGNDTMTESCFLRKCPVDGSWAKWSPWSACDVTCEDGVSYRTRNCSKPEPMYGGKDCSGSATDSLPCTLEACPTWSAWYRMPCSTTCGNGTLIKVRNCSSGHSENCSGNDTMTESCFLRKCPVDGSWTNWSPWSACDVTCEDGVSYRTRNCSNPEPMYGGKDCSGSATDSLPCTLEACPTWSAWYRKSCSTTCGNGTMVKVRNCSTGHSESCVGNDTMIESCFLIHCPVDGSWAEWSSWSACDVSCETGSQRRQRTCTKPEPQYGGRGCTGDTSQIQTCTLQACPTWSSWSKGPCSKTCGEGTQVITRNCSTGQPVDCGGNDSLVIACLDQHCAVDGAWGEWYPWSACDVTCEHGNLHRYRNCSNPEPLYGGRDCSGISSQTHPCTLEACPTWSSWYKKPCSKTCDEGVQIKARHCSTGHAEDCGGNETMTMTCLIQHCPVDGGWTDWVPWSACDVTCESGFAHRTRNCSNPEPMYGGHGCPGLTNQQKPCSLAACPTWSSWYYSDCTATCGGGTWEKYRMCSSDHDEDCPGEPFKKEACNEQNCPGDGQALIPMGRAVRWLLSWLKE